MIHISVRINHWNNGLACPPSLANDRSLEVAEKVLEYNNYRIFRFFARAVSSGRVLRCLFVEQTT